MEDITAQEQSGSEEQGEKKVEAEQSASQEHSPGKAVKADMTAQEQAGSQEWGDAEWSASWSADAAHQDCAAKWEKDDEWKGDKSAWNGSWEAQASGGGDAWKEDGAESNVPEVAGKDERADSAEKDGAAVAQVEDAAKTDATPGETEAVAESTVPEVAGKDAQSDSAEQVGAAVTQVEDAAKTDATLVEMVAVAESNVPEVAGKDALSDSAEKESSAVAQVEDMAKTDAMPGEMVAVAESNVPEVAGKDAKADSADKDGVEAAQVEDAAKSDATPGETVAVAEAAPQSTPDCPKWGGAEVELTYDEDWALTNDRDLTTQLGRVGRVLAMVSKAADHEMKVDNSRLTAVDGASPSDCKKTRLAMKYAKLVCVANNGWIDATADLICEDDGDVVSIELPLDVRMETVIGKTGDNLIKTGFQTGTVCFADRLSQNAATKSQRPAMNNYSQQSWAPFWLQAGKHVRVRKQGDVREVRFEAGTIEGEGKGGTYTVKIHGIAQQVQRSRLQPKLDEGMEVEFKLAGEWTKGSLAEQVDSDVEAGNVAVVQAMPMGVESAEVMVVRVPIDDVREVTEETQDEAKEEEDIPEPPAPRAKIFLFGTPAARGRAFLSFAALMDKKQAGSLKEYFDSGCSWGGLPGEDWGADIHDIPDGMIGKLIGKKGSMRKKMCLASGCVIEFFEEKHAIAAGPAENRKCALGILETLTSCEGDIPSVPDSLEVFASKLAFPEEALRVVPGPQRSTLNQVEEQDQVLTFILQKKQQWADEEWGDASWGGNQGKWDKAADDEPAETEKAGSGAAVAEYAEGCGQVSADAAADGEVAPPGDGDAGAGADSDAGGRTEKSKSVGDDAASGDADCEQDAVRKDDVEASGEVADKYEEKQEKQEESWDNWEEPARELVIVGTSLRGRKTATLRMMAVIEAKVPGHYSVTLAPSEEDDFVTDIVDLADFSDDLSECFKRVEACTGAGVAVIGPKVAVIGTSRQVAKAVEFIGWLAKSTSGPGGLRRVCVPNRVFEDREDVISMNLTSQDWEALSTDETILTDAIQANEVLVIVREQTAAESLAVNNQIYLREGRRTFQAVVSEVSENAEGTMELRLTLKDAAALAADQAVFSDKEDGEMFIVVANKGGRNQAVTALREALDYHHKQNADWPAGGDGGNDDSWDAGWGGAEEGAKTNAKDNLWANWSANASKPAASDDWSCAWGGKAKPAKEEGGWGAEKGGASWDGSGGGQSKNAGQGAHLGGWAAGNSHGGGGGNSWGKADNAWKAGCGAGGGAGGGGNQGGKANQSWGDGWEDTAAPASAAIKEEDWKAWSADKASLGFGQPAAKEWDKPQAAAWSNGRPSAGGGLGANSSWPGTGALAGGYGSTVVQPVGGTYGGAGPVSGSRYGDVRSVGGPGAGLYSDTGRGYDPVPPRGGFASAAASQPAAPLPLAGQPNNQWAAWQASSAGGSQIDAPRQAASWMQ